jgi:hypothetical protein
VRSAIAQDIKPGFFHKIGHGIEVRQYAQRVAKSLRRIAVAAEPPYQSEPIPRSVAHMGVLHPPPTRPSDARFAPNPSLAYAKKCKHCGEFLDKRNAINTTVASASVRRPGDIICPHANCHYQGPPRKVPRGSVLVGLLLLLFFIIPGVLYFIFMQGYRYYCPRVRPTDCERKLISS